MVKVKICGLTTIESVNAAIDNGADFLGFVFFDKSPRNISIENAKNLAIHARGFSPNIQICAVIVNPDDELISNLQNAFAPDYLQLHGNEDLTRIKQLQENGFNIIKAIGVETAHDIKAASEFFNVAQYILFDAKPPKNSENAGGFGISFDWSILQNLPQDLNWFLSGGLNPENVKAAIAATNAPNVDVSSGIESQKGIKDNTKIAQFLQQAKV